MNSPNSDNQPVEIEDLLQQIREMQQQLMQQQIQAMADMSRKLQLYSSTMQKAYEFQMQAYQILYGTGGGTPVPYGLGGNYNLGGAPYAYPTR